MHPISLGKHISSKSWLSTKMAVALVVVVVVVVAIVAVVYVVIVVIVKMHLN